jgi:dTDP-4-dehydrorhamnose reductase
MKIPLLMTGATGLVGSRFVELYADKYEIFNMDLTTGVDITNKGTIEQFVKDHPAKAMIHLAAFTDTKEAFKQDGDHEGICYKVNVLGTRNISQVAKSNNIHLIHISTDFVFDGTSQDPYTEDLRVSPIDWYGKTKALAEQEVISSGASYTIVRIAYPYRANFPNKPDIIEKIRAGLESQSLFPQFGDTIITPTLVDDIAKGFDILVTNKPTGIYHLVGSSSHSPYELAKMVAQTYGYDESQVKEGSLTEYLKSSPRPFARFGRISNGKLVSEFGFTPKTLVEGLKTIKAQQDTL